MKRASPDNGIIVYLIHNTTINYSPTKLFMRSLLLLLLPLSIFAQDKKINKTATAKALALSML